MVEILLGSCLGFLQRTNTRRKAATDEIFEYQNPNVLLFPNRDYQRF